MARVIKLWYSLYEWTAVEWREREQGPPNENETFTFYKLIFES